jgi:hypothetical protein
MSESRRPGRRRPLGCRRYRHHRLEDLFGADRTRPFARVDRAGLAWFIGEGEVVAITAETATIQKPSGARQTFYRRPGDVNRP